MSSSVTTHPPNMPVPKQRGRRPLTPRERAKLPLTYNVTMYVAWLDREVFDGKLSGAQRHAAGIAITLYGAYQHSPEHRAIR